jgi:hypothetical protein
MIEAGLVSLVRPGPSARGERGREFSPNPAPFLSPKHGPEIALLPASHSCQNRILTRYRGEVYLALSQAGPGNDINAG